jgi:hypothetical protein
MELEIPDLENLAPRIRSPSIVGGNKARTSDTEVRWIVNELRISNRQVAIAF